jgi:hypothetical protein
MPAKIVRPEEALAHPFAMTDHLSFEGVSRKMGVDEHHEHEYAYRMGIRRAEDEAKRRNIEKNHGPTIDNHLRYVPEGYRHQLRLKYLGLINSVRIRDYSQVERVLSKLPAECHAVRQVAKSMGIPVPGPLDYEGQFPPLGIFTEMEIEDARQG